MGIGNERIVLAARHAGVNIFRHFAGRSPETIAGVITHSADPVRKSCGAVPLVSLVSQPIQR
ncbi:hypothetical protein D3C71_2159170 [compost metagenome]